MSLRVKYPLQLCIVYTPPYTLHFWNKSCQVEQVIYETHPLYSLFKLSQKLTCDKRLSFQFFFKTAEGTASLRFKVEVCSETTAWDCIDGSQHLKWIWLKIRLPVYWRQADKDQSNTRKSTRPVVPSYLIATTKPRYPISSTYSWCQFRLHTYCV